MKIAFYRTPVNWWLAILSFSLLPAFFVISCDKQVIEDFDINYGFDYYPLEPGKYRVYAVDSVIYDPVNSGTFIDTISLMIKEEVIDTFYDSSHELNYVLRRSQRYDITAPWEETDTWYALRDSQKAVLTEENLRFVKLTFPVKQFNTWNGNSFIDPGLIVDIRGETIEMFKNWNYEVAEILDTETIGTYQFENVAHIKQADDENLIEKRYAIEKYVRGVGLVFRELKILDTQNIDPNLPWEVKAEKGFILHQLLIEYN